MPVPPAPEPPVEKPRPWYLGPYLHLLLATVLSAVAQPLLKMGTDETIGGAGAILGIGALKSPWVWLGIAAFVTSLLSWLYALRFIPLNIAFNLAGILYVLVPLEGWIVMGDHVSPQHWAGIVLVFAGVIITAREAVKLEQKL